MKMYLSYQDVLYHFAYLYSLAYFFIIKNVRVMALFCTDERNQALKLLLVTFAVTLVVGFDV